MLKLVSSRSADWAADVSPPQGMRVRTDDFSVMISSDDDELFWVRIEHSLTTTATVSDFKPADQSDETAGAALAAGLTISVLNGPPRRCRFLDITPGDRGDKDAAADRIIACLAHCARTFGQEIERHSLEANGRKFDLIVDLEDRLH